MRSPLITPRMLQLVQTIARTLGVLEGEKLDVDLLGDKAWLSSLHASLAIEGNPLTLEQMRALAEQAPSSPSQKESIEVHNALALYAQQDTLDPLSREDFLGAHKALMASLSSEAGVWRSCGNQDIAATMTSLFDFVKTDPTSWLIKACLFPYVIEYTRPFSEGNGRMGRLWQHLLLAKEHPLFRHVPIEAAIKDHLPSYYGALTMCESIGDPTPFIELALAWIAEALTTYMQQAKTMPKEPQTRLRYAKEKLGNTWFARKAYMEIFHEISSATASRDLKLGQLRHILSTKGTHNQLVYKFA